MDLFIGIFFYLYFNFLERTRFESGIKKNSKRNKIKVNKYNWIDKNLLNLIENIKKLISIKIYLKK